MMRVSILPAIGILLLVSLCSLPVAGAENLSPAFIGPRNHLTGSDSMDVWIFLEDKGIPQESITQALSKVEEELLPEAKTRRQKVKSGRLVSYRDLPVSQEYVTRILNLGVRYRTVSRYMNALSVRTPQSILPQLLALDFVTSIRPVAKGRRNLPEPNWTSPAKYTSHQVDGVDELDYGPSYDQLNQINVVAVHDSGYSGNGVLVCLLDTGFFTDHEALVNQPVVAEWDFINNDPETQNELGDDPSQHNHGTYTFSALGGAHEGDLYGPAYGATFIIGKTESIEFEEPIEEDWYVAGVEWADSLGAQVISTSLGYLDWYDFEDLDGNTTVTAVAVDIAAANGIVFVTAAGNERESSWGHIITPADADSVIAVGAVDEFGVIADFSSPGPTADGRIKPEVCARGVQTWCATTWGGTSGYNGIGGTSLSTPLVGGACALILEAHPDWTPLMIKSALMATADNAQTPDNDYGWGIIDVLAAINYNFPPNIIQRHPEAGTQIVYLDSLLDFWVSATDYEGDPLLYRWLIDDQELYYGADSAFSQFWDETGLHTVTAIVEDRYLGTDTTIWNVEVEIPGAVSELPVGGIPGNFALYAGYPNPFNASTTIRFDLAQPAAVCLQVFDVSGRLVQTLIDGRMSPGRYATSFTADELTSGVYFYRLQAGDFVETRKLTYLK